MSYGATILRFVIIAIIVSVLTATLFVLGTIFESPAAGFQLVGLFFIVVLFALIYTLPAMLLFGLPALQVMRAYHWNISAKRFVFVGAVVGAVASVVLNFVLFSVDVAFVMESLKFIIPLGFIGGGAAGFFWWRLVEQSRLASS